MTLTERILAYLSRQRYGATFRKIEIDLNDNPDEVFINPESLRVTLSKLTNRGLLRSEEAEECAQCGCSSKVYRITERGRIKINWEV